MKLTSSARKNSNRVQGSFASAGAGGGSMYGFIEFRVRDAMTPPVTISASATLADAERVFEERDFNMLPVVEGNRMVGVLSKLDLMKAFAFTNSSLIPPYAEIMQRPVKQYMNTEPFVADPEMPLTRALQRMVETRCKSLPVVREKRIVGIVAREDVLRALRCAVAGGGRDAVRSRRWRRPLRDRGFLAEVAQAMACNARRAEAVTRAVLRELHDRLTSPEADDLAAQLPRELKRMWSEFDRPRTMPRKIHRSAFLRHVRENANLRTEEEAERATRAVFRALQLLLGSSRGLEGEAWDVFSQLPKDLKRLWIASSEPVLA